MNSRGHPPRGGGVGGEEKAGPGYEAIEMLFTPIPNVHHRSKMRTIDLQSKQSMSQKQSNK